MIPQAQATQQELQIARLRQLYRFLFLSQDLSSWSGASKSQEQGVSLVARRESGPDMFNL